MVSVKLFVEVKVYLCSLWELRQKDTSHFNDGAFDYYSGVLLPELPQDVERHMDNRIDLASLQLPIPDNQDQHVLVFIVANVAEGMTLYFQFLGSLSVDQASIA